MTPYGQAEMQLRQPLQTSCWMKTVSNSVRMIALVGQTSMQLAWAQCLHTSLIISQACPPSVFWGWEIVSPGRTVSRNLTCRQFWAPSSPDLSELSCSRGGLPGSWFHSLQATARALQPMQLFVRARD